MPIKLPNHLPATQILEGENIFVMDKDRAYSQDIRPLKLLLLNLMPNKMVTETQLLRLLGNTPLQIEVDFIYTKTYQPKTTPKSHLANFYGTFDNVKNNFYDGLIITGAPVDGFEYEEVAYWEEVKEIMDWSRKHVWSTFHICWGAFAGLYHHFGVKKVSLKEKIFGVYKHKVNKKHEQLFRGFDDEFFIPHSRFIALDEEDLKFAAEEKGLEILSSGEAGPCVIANFKDNEFFVTGHAEYDPDSLLMEYTRDKKAGKNIAIPINYFPDDDINKEPKVTWRSVANLMFSNWLNYYVYQETPYIIEKVKENKYTRDDYII